jgi:hypothetical protein
MRIQQAAGRLGLSFVHLTRIVAFDPEIDTACWISSDDRILVGPKIAAMDIDLIEMVLRHEFLHRATYNGFYQRFPDPQIANVALDICINRLLYEGYPEKMCALSRYIYPAESKTTLVALADCTAEPSRLPEELASLWRYIWERDRSGQFRQLNPASLYYQLASAQQNHREPGGIDTSPWADRRPERDTGGNNAPLSGRSRAAVEQVIRNTGAAVGSGSQLGRELSAYLGVAVQIGTTRLYEFMRAIETERLTSDVTQPIREVVREAGTQAWPGMPTRRGLVLLTTGLSSTMGIYHNQWTESRPRRLSLALYVDVSGSMEPYLPLVHAVVGAVLTVPLVIRLFSDRVREVTVEEFRKGATRVGGGTQLAPVLNDLLADDQIGSALIATDGDMESVPADLVEKLTRSGKKLYVLYFGDGALSGPLASLAVRWLGVAGRG